MDSDYIRDRLIKSGLSELQAAGVVLGLLELRNQILGWFVWVCCAAAIILGIFVLLAK